MTFLKKAPLIGCSLLLSSTAAGQLPTPTVLDCNTPFEFGTGISENPCDGHFGVAVGHVGHWTIPFKTGDVFLHPGSDSNEEVAGTLGKIRRIKRMHGCAGTYESIAIVKEASGGLDAGTAGNVELSGSKKWISGFCTGPSCECNPNAHTWDLDYSVTATVQIALNFNNSLLSNGAANGAATAIMSIPFHPNEIHVKVDASGEETATEVALSLWSFKDENGVFFNLSKTITSDTWNKIIPASALRTGEGIRGCGFIGKHYSIGSSTSAESGIQSDALSALARGKTFIGSNSATWVTAIGDVCVDPLGGMGDREGARILDDGTPVPVFLEMLANADLPASTKAEMLYAAEVWGPETDYYAYLLSEDDTALQEFYDSIDTDLLGIASLEDFIIARELER